MCLIMSTCQNEEKKKGKRGFVEKIHLRPRLKKDENKSKFGNRGGKMDDSSEDEAKKSKHRLGIMDKIRRFSSREELSNVSNDEEHQKNKKKKKKDKDKRKKHKTEDEDEDNKGGKEVVKLRKAKEHSSPANRFRRSIGRLVSEDDSSDEEDFAREVVNAANRYRKKHRIKKLKPNKDLNFQAHERAKMLAREKYLLETSDEKYGTNIYRKPLEQPDEKITAEETVNAWYEEIENFHFEEEPNNIYDIKNATQLLWRDSREMGVGKAHSTNKDIVFVAAFFSPRGNIKGEFAHQVPPIGGFARSTEDLSLRDLSYSSSDAEDIKDNNEQSPHETKKKKRKFLSHIIGKIRKYSDGSIDPGKHKDKQHPGYIGHRQGKYVLNDSDEDERRNSHSNALTTKDIKDARKASRLSGTIPSEATENLRRIDIGDHQPDGNSMSTTQETSYTLKYHDSPERKSSDYASLERPRENQTKFEEEKKVFSYTSEETKVVTSSLHQTTYEEKITSSENHRENSLVIKIKEPTDESSSCDSDHDIKACKKKKRGLMSKFKDHFEKRHYEVSSKEHHFKENSEKNVTHIEKEENTSKTYKTSSGNTENKSFVSEKIKVFEPPGYSTHKNPQGTSSSDEGKHNTEKKQQTSGVTDFFSGFSAQKSTTTSPKDKDNVKSTEKDTQETVKEEWCSTDKAEDKKEEFTFKNFQFDSFETEMMFKNSHSDGELGDKHKENDSSSSDEEKGKVMWKLGESFIYKPNICEEKLEECEKDAKSKSSDGSSSDEDKLKYELKFDTNTVDTCKSEILIDLSEPGQLEGNLERKNSCGSSSDESKKKDRIKTTYKTKISFDGSTNENLRDHFDKKNSSCSSSDEDDKREKIKAEERIDTSTTKTSGGTPPKTGLLGKLTSHFDKESDDSCSSDDDKKKDKIKIEKEIDDKTPDYETQKSGFTEKLTGYFNKKTDDSSSSSEEDKKEKKFKVETETYDIKTHSVDDKSPKPGFIEKITSHFDRKADDSSSSDEDEKDIKIKVEKDVHVKNPQDSGVEPHKTGVLGKLTSHFSKKSESSCSSDEDDNNETKIKTEKEIHVKNSQDSGDDPHRTGAIKKLKSRFDKKSGDSSSSDEDKEKVKIKAEKNIDTKKIKDSDEEHNNKTGIFKKITSHFDNKSDDSCSSDEEDKREIKNYTETRKIEIHSPGEKLTSHFHRKKGDSSSSGEEDIEINFEEHKNIHVKKTEDSSDKLHRTGELGKLKSHFDKKSNDSCPSDEDNKKEGEMKVDKNIDIKKTQDSGVELNKPGFLEKLTGHFDKKSDDSSSSDEDDKKEKIEVETEASKTKVFCSDNELRQIRLFGKITSSSEKKEDSSSSSDDDDYKETKNKLEKDNYAKKNQVSDDEPHRTGVGLLGKLKTHFDKKSDDSCSSDEDDRKEKFKVETETHETKVHSPNEKPKTKLFEKLTSHFNKKDDDNDSCSSDEDNNKEDTTKIGPNNEVTTQLSGHKSHKPGLFSKLSSHFDKTNDECSSSDEDDKEVKIKVDNDKDIDDSRMSPSKPSKLDMLRKRLSSSFSKKTDDGDSSDEEQKKSMKETVEKDASELKTQVSQSGSQKAKFFGKLSSHFDKKTEERHQSKDEKKEKIKDDYDTTTTTTANVSIYQPSSPEESGTRSSFSDRKSSEYSSSEETDLRFQGIVNKDPTGFDKKLDDRSTSCEEEKKDEDHKVWNKKEKPRRKSKLFEKLKNRFEKKGEKCGSSSDEDEHKHSLMAEKNDIKTPVSDSETHKVGFFGKITSHLHKNTDECSSSSDEDERKTKIKVEKNVGKSETHHDQEPHKDGFLGKFSTHFNKKADADESSSSSDEEENRDKVKGGMSESKESSPKKNKKFGMLRRLSDHFKSDTSKHNFADEEEKKAKIEVKKDVHIMKTRSIEELQKGGLFKKSSSRDKEINKCISSDEDQKEYNIAVDNVGIHWEFNEPYKPPSLDKHSEHFDKKVCECTSSDEDKEKNTKDEAYVISTHIGDEEPEEVGGTLRKFLDKFDKITNDSSSSDEDEKNTKTAKGKVPPVHTTSETNVLGLKKEGDKNYMIKVEKTDPDIDINMDAIKKEDKVGFFKKIKDRFEKEKEDVSSSDEEKEKDKKEKQKTPETSDYPVLGEAQKPGLIDTIRGKFVKESDESSSSSDENENKGTVKVERDSTSAVKYEILVTETSKIPIALTDTPLVSTKNEEDKKNYMIKVDNKTDSDVGKDTLKSENKIGFFEKLKGHFDKDTEDVSSSDGEKETDKKEKKKDTETRDSPISGETQKTGLFEKIRGQFAKEKDSSSSSSDENEKRDSVKLEEISMTEAVRNESVNRRSDPCDEKLVDISSSEDEKEEKIRTEKDPNTLRTYTSLDKLYKAGLPEVDKRSLSNKSSDNSSSDEEDKNKITKEDQNKPIIKKIEGSAKENEKRPVSKRLSVHFDEQGGSCSHSGEEKKDKLKPIIKSSDISKTNSIDSVDEGIILGRTSVEIERKVDERSSSDENERHEVKSGQGESTVVLMSSGSTDEPSNVGLIDTIEDRFEAVSFDTSSSDDECSKRRTNSDAKRTSTAESDKRDSIEDEDDRPDKQESIFKMFERYIKRKTSSLSLNNDTQEKKKDAETLYTTKTVKNRYDTSSDDSCSSDDDDSDEERRQREMKIEKTSSLDVSAKHEVFVSAIQNIDSRRGRKADDSSSSDDEAYRKRRTITIENGNVVSERCENVKHNEKENNSIDYDVESIPSLNKELPPKEYMEQITNSINYYRQKHRANDVILDQQLCYFASDRAKILSSGVFGTIPSDLGENIFSFTSQVYFSKEGAEFIVESWYRRIAYHDFDNEPERIDFRAGSFTQLVWKESKRVGIGWHEDPREQRTILVAVFSPAGNVRGQFKDQLSPL